MRRPPWLSRIARELDIERRTPEGTGAALALPLVQASLAIVAEMATFAAAAVTDAGR